MKIFRPDGDACGVNEAGEIFMRQTAMPDFDYHGNAEARAEAGRDGLVSVGDVGYLDEDGYLFLCDRKRDMVISGGVNIYPAEIENALIGMDGVRDCAVFGIPDDEFGERLCACIEPEPDAALSSDAVQEFLRGRLANFKVPKDIKFLDTLPREASGKIFKRKLRDLYGEGTARRTLIAAQRRIGNERGKQPTTRFKHRCYCQTVTGRGKDRGQQTPEIDMKATDFIVGRNDLQQCKAIETQLPDAATLPDEALLVKVTRFAFTANNITYAVLGDQMKYWSLFPAPDGFGNVPVWGFGEVIASRHPNIAAGEMPVRLFSDGDASGDRGCRRQQARPARRRRAPAGRGAGL